MDITDSLSASGDVPAERLSDEVVIKQLSNNEAVMISLEQKLKELNSVLSEIKGNASVNKALAVAIEAIAPDTLPETAPVASYTEDPSKTNYDATIDAVEIAQNKTLRDAIAKVIETLQSFQEEKSRIFNHVSNTWYRNSESLNKFRPKIELLLKIFEKLEALEATTSEQGERISSPTVVEATTEITNRMETNVRPLINQYFQDILLNDPKMFAIQEELRNDLVVGTLAFDTRLMALTDVLNAIPHVGTDLVNKISTGDIQYRFIRSAHQDGAVHDREIFLEEYFEKIVNAASAPAVVVPCVGLIGKASECGLVYHDKDFTDRLKCITDRMTHTLMACDNAVHAMDRISFTEDEKLVAAIFSVIGSLAQETLILTRLYLIFCVTICRAGKLVEVIYDNALSPLTDLTWQRMVAAKSPELKELLLEYHAIRENGDRFTKSL